MQTVGFHVEAPTHGELDAADAGTVERYFAQRKVELLVCCAGAIADAPLARLSTEAWQSTWRANFATAQTCARAVLPGMCKRGGGHLVFLSSYSALHPPIGQAAYATAKAALLGLTQDIARQYGSQNIRANAILPGFLETKMTRAVSEKRRTQVAAEHTLGKLNTPAATAAFIRFLHCEMPHTSGQAFQLDSRVDRGFG